MINIISSEKDLNIPRIFKKILRPVLDVAEEVNAKLYLFGGFVRDLISNKFPSDGDIYVENFLSTVFTDKLMQKGIIYKKRDYIGPITMKEDIQIMLSETTINSFDFDFVSSDLPNIQSYLKRSDFTINTIYYDLQTDSLFDFTHRGISDIKNKILYPVSNQLTPLEALRAVKLIMSKGYSLDPKTISIIRTVAPEFKNIDMGLIIKILQKIFSVDSNKAEMLLNQLGILSYIPDYILESIKL